MLSAILWLYDSYNVDLRMLYLPSLASCKVLRDATNNGFKSDMGLLVMILPARDCTERPQKNN